MPSSFLGSLPVTGAKLENLERVVVDVNCAGRVEVDDGPRQLGEFVAPHVETLKFGQPANVRGQGREAAKANVDLSEVRAAVDDDRQERATEIRAVVDAETLEVWAVLGDGYYGRVRETSLAPNAEKSELRAVLGESHD